MKLTSLLKQGFQKSLALYLLAGTVNALYAQAADSLQAETTIPDSSSQRISWFASVTTELQANLTERKTGWSNYIEAGFQAGLWKNATLDVDAIATYEINTPVAKDLQYFSNITIGANRAFRLMQLGISQQIGEHWLVSAGLRNTDIDYFSSPYTAFFTGSSHGSFPTLSFNYSLASAPLSALALHLEYKPIPNLTIQETFYNGVADDRLDRQFRFCPKGDGMLNFIHLHYTDNERYTYNIGYALGNSKITDEESGLSTKNFQYTLWMLAEQQLCTLGTSGLGLLLQGSASPREDSYCTCYWGCGLLCDKLGKIEAQIGMCLNRVLFQDAHETDIEMTASLPVWQYLAIQPSLHCINSDGKYRIAALLRAVFEIGN